MPHNTAHQPPRSPDWVIWSFEHDAWWAPHECGYVLELARAGRYPEARAREIEAQANIVRQNEVALSLLNAQALAEAAGLMTLQEAAAETGIPSTSLSTLILRGDLPRAWIARADLKALVERYDDAPTDPM